MSNTTLSTTPAGDASARTTTTTPGGHQQMSAGASSSSSSSSGNISRMKRADKRSSINILVLGDEGVGKSSLISTFVARFFSEVVPGVMAQVRLPPDPELGCVTTIVDSQGGDAELISLVAAMTERQQQQSGGGGGDGGGNPSLLTVPLAGQQSSSSSSSTATDPSLAALMERADALQRQHQQQISSPTQQQQQGAIGSPQYQTPQRQQQQQQQQQQHLASPTTPLGVASATGGGSYYLSSTPGMSGRSRGGAGRANAAAPENVDSVILVYDLDRVETFYRLENHWLPLIERCYQGKVPVIVAENKMDLFRPSSTAGMTDEQALQRKRQQIVSLMQRYTFIRQCIKCSAKNLLRVDDVFLKSQQAVIYPLTPLYDLTKGCLTFECKRAFTRIFRMYDRDRDGLLNDSEIDRFQRETYHVQVFERDLSAWKKVVTRNNPVETDVVIQDGMFTVAGFLAIFDVFISQNRLDVVWQALRKFGYDDDLNLHVPDTVTAPTDDHLAKSWKLSSSAKRFLTEVFHQFDSDNDGVVTADDLRSIFSILPAPTLPPWHPRRAPELFDGCFSLPKVVSSGTSESTAAGDDDGQLIVAAGMSQVSTTLSTAGISILSASDSLPSVHVDLNNNASPPVSYLGWMGHWHAISAISPSVTRSELYRLGHVESKRSTSSRRGRGRKKRASSVSPIDMVYDASLDSREIRVLVLGSHSSGKTALLNALCHNIPNATLTESTPTATGTVMRSPKSTVRPETSSAFVKLKRKVSVNGGSKTEEDGEEFVVHLVFTDVPETAAASHEEHLRELSELFGSTASPNGRVCDLAMLVFDCTTKSSLVYAKELEANYLTKETPRVFVGTKSDLVQKRPDSNEGDAMSATVVDAAEIHCREQDLEPPLLTSATDATFRNKALDHLARCALNEPGVDRLKSKPHEERDRREAARRRKKMIWLTACGVVSVVVAVGVGLLWGGGSSPKKDSSKGSGGLGWLRGWLGGSTKAPPVSSA